MPAWKSEGWFQLQGHPSGPLIVKGLSSPLVLALYIAKPFQYNNTKRNKSTASNTINIYRRKSIFFYLDYVRGLTTCLDTDLWVNRWPCVKRALCERMPCGTSTEQISQGFFLHLISECWCRLLLTNKTV